MAKFQIVPASYGAHLLEDQFHGYTRVLLIINALKSPGYLEFQRAFFFKKQPVDVE